MWREKKFLGARDDEKFGRDWRLESGDKWSWPQVRKTMIWPNAQGVGDGGGREGQVFPHKCEEAVAGTLEQPYAFKF